MVVRRVLVLGVVLWATTGCGSLADWMPPVATTPSTAPSASTTAPPTPGRLATVDRVSDGDTIDVLSGKGGGVRILGLDSPETVDPRKPVQCGGPESSAWAREQLPVGSQVRLVPDPTQEKIDRFGRELAYVEYRRLGSDEWLDFSAESIRAGHARAYVYDNSPVSRHPQYLELEAQARMARIGLWACPENIV